MHLDVLNHMSWSKFHCTGKVYRFGLKRLNVNMGTIDQSNPHSKSCNANCNCNAGSVIASFIPVSIYHGSKIQMHQCVMHMRLSACGFMITCLFCSPQFVHLLSACFHPHYPFSALDLVCKVQMFLAVLLLRWVVVVPDLNWGLWSSHHALCWRQPFFTHTLFTQ